MNVKEISEQVIAELCGNAPLESVSSKVQIVSNSIENAAFRLWVLKEFISGYDDNEDLPEYRVFHCPNIKATYIVNAGFNGMIKVSNQSVPIMNLGKEVYEKIMTIRLKESAPIIQSFIAKQNACSLSLSPYEMRAVQMVLSDDAQIVTACKEIPAYAFRNIVDNVKAKLINIFMDLNKTVFNNTMNFNPESKKDTITNIINNNIYYPGIVNTGSGQIPVSQSTIIAGQNNANTSNIVSNLSEKVLELERLVKEIRPNDLDFNQTVAQIKGELVSEKPKKGFLDICFKYLKSLPKVIAISGVDEIISECIQSLNLL